jgi:hypothetical protein
MSNRKGYQGYRVMAVAWAIFAGFAFDPSMPKSYPRGAVMIGVICGLLSIHFAIYGKDQS